MDTEFKTTFIPKKNLSKAPEVENPKKRLQSSILGIIALLLFLTAVVSIAGVYLYKIRLATVLNTRIESINTAEKAFEPAVVLELKKLDIRLNAGTELLAQHVALSDFLKSLAESTLPEVSFSDLNFTYDVDGPKVSMAGEARGYLPIAQQSDVFQANQYIQNHIFSDFVLNDTGNIAFTLNFTLNKDLLLFGRTVANNEVEIDETLSPEGVLIQDQNISEEGTNIDFSNIPIENQQPVEGSSELNPFSGVSGL